MKLRWQRIQDSLTSLQHTQGSPKANGLSSAEGDHIASHLPLFLEKKDLPSLFRQKGDSRSSPYPGPDDDGTISIRL